MASIAPDRLAASIRPEGRPVMYQEWRHLLFLHWEVPADSLQALLPPGLEVDTFEGRAFIGLVPFTMQGVRPRGLPSVPWLSNFHETNVRTYVLRDGTDPGVWFFSLDAANPVAVAIARAGFGLPYFHARMGLDVDVRGDSEAGLTYVSERFRSPVAARSRVRARVGGAERTAVPGSLDHFLVERYVLYSRRRGRLFRGQVHHRPYPLVSASVESVEETLLDATGLRRPDAPPMVHYAAGVDVEVFGLTSA